MKQFFQVLFLLFANLIVAQNKTFRLSLEDDFKLNQQLNLCLDKDQSLQDYEIGDLNKDNKDDLILIANSEMDAHANRKIYLFTNQGNHQFKLAATNQNIIECGECGGMGVGDPYEKTVIESGFFSFDLLYGSNCKDAVTVTFKCDPKKKNWFLHKDTIQTYCNEVGPDGAIKSKISEPNKKDYGKKFEDY